MSENLNKVAQNEFEFVKGIVRESNSKISDYDCDSRSFSLTSESMGGTIVNVDFKAFRTVLFNELRIKYVVCVDEEEVVNRISAINGVNLFKLIYRNQIDSIDDAELEEINKSDKV